MELYYTLNERASWGHMTRTSRIKILLMVAGGLFLLAAALLIIQASNRRCLRRIQAGGRLSPLPVLIRSKC